MIGSSRWRRAPWVDTADVRWRRDPVWAAIPRRVREVGQHALEWYGGHLCRDFDWARALLRAMLLPPNCDQLLGLPWCDAAAWWVEFHCWPLAILTRLFWGTRRVALGQRHHVQRTRMHGSPNAHQWDTIARVEGLLEFTQGSLRWLMQSTRGDDVNYVVRGGGESCRSGLGHVVVFLASLFLFVSLFFECLGTAAPMEAVAMLPVGDCWTQIALTNDNVWAKTHIRVGVFPHLRMVVCPHVQVRLDQVSHFVILWWCRFPSKLVGPAVHRAGFHTIADVVIDDSTTMYTACVSSHIFLWRVTLCPDLAPYRRLLISQEVDWPSSARVRYRTHRRHRQRLTPGPCSSCVDGAVAVYSHIFLNGVVTLCPDLAPYRQTADFSGGWLAQQCTGQVATSPPTPAATTPGPCSSCVDGAVWRWFSHTFEQSGCPTPVLYRRVRMPRPGEFLHFRGSFWIADCVCELFSVPDLWWHHLGYENAGERYLFGR